MGAGDGKRRTNNLALAAIPRVAVLSDTRLLRSWKRPRLLSPLQAESATNIPRRSELMLSTTGLMSKVRESVDGDVVISLAVSPSEVDLSFLQRMFDDANW